MSVTVNLRNNTTFFIKVNGIEEVIVPNTEIEDKTIQWISTENKTIQIFNDEQCSGQPICASSLNFVTNDGIFVDRGSTNQVKMQADVTGVARSVVHDETNELEKLLEWSEIVPETTVNLSFWNK